MLANIKANERTEKDEAEDEDDQKDDEGSGSILMCSGVGMYVASTKEEQRLSLEVVWTMEEERESREKILGGPALSR